MTYANKQPESPKGQVYEAFKSKGVEAARKLAQKLEISASRVNRWLKDSGAGFQRTATKPSDDKPAPKAKAKPVKAAKAAKATPAKKPVKKPVAKKGPAPKAEPAQAVSA